MESQRDNVLLVILAVVLILSGVAVQNATATTSSSTTAATPGGTTATDSTVVASTAGGSTSEVGAAAQTGTTSPASTTGTSDSPTQVDPDGTWPDSGSVVIVRDLQVLSIAHASDDVWRCSLLSGSGTTHVMATLDADAAYELYSLIEKDADATVSLRAHYAGIQNLSGIKNRALVDCSLA